jgi:hypothetical protein
MCVRLAGLLPGRGTVATTTAEPVLDAGAANSTATPTAPPTPDQGTVTCGFPTSPIVGLDAVPSATPSGAPTVAGRSAQARAHEAAAEVLADRGDWRRAYQHLKAAVSLVRDERTTPDEVPDQLRIEVDRLRRAEPSGQPHGHLEPSLSRRAAEHAAW